MKNIIGYAASQLQTFEESPFCAVDSLILSELSYLKLEQLPVNWRTMERVTIRELYKSELFDRLFSGMGNRDKDRRLLAALAASPRFREIQAANVCHKFEPENEKQFCGITYFLPDGGIYVCFRGTDSTLVGWKEDVNMAFNSEIPSQRESVAYLNATAGLSAGTLLVGGHSKGGNLAVYSALYCERAIQDRIYTVYCHDSPGFKEAVFEQPQYLRISDRISKTLPQSSVIGMLLEHQEAFSVVCSARHGIMQHDPFSWCLEDTGFCYAAGISASANYVNRTIHDWLYELPEEKRELFFDTLYHVLTACNVTTVSELPRLLGREAPTVVAALRNVDPETRKFIVQTLKSLAGLSLRHALS